jgi:hypothetical protein
MTRTWLCVAALLILPITVYWQTVFHEYGFRDDYAHLREVREEPGKLFNFTASNGRPVYGAVLESSLKPVYDVSDLPLLRLTGAVLLTAAAVALFLMLRRGGWSDVEALGVALATTLLPGSQVAIGWAIAWPIVLSMVFSLAGFAAVEAYLARPAWRRLPYVAAGAALYFVAGLTYQSTALFAVVPLAALLLVRSDRAKVGHYRWLGMHLGVLFASLFAAFVLMKVLYLYGVFPASDRMVSFEAEPLDKLVWFVTQPLANALGLFALRDVFGTGEGWFWACVAATAAVIALGYRFWAVGSLRSERRRWLVALVFLPFVAHSVSLAAGERAIGYRTILALAGVVIVLFVYALRGLRVDGRITPRTQHAALGAFMVIAAVSANHNAFTLIAEPQNREWQIVDEAVERMKVDADTKKVYIIEPLVSERSTKRMFADEFGSLSADSDWVPREMFKAALRERFGRNFTAKYVLQFGHNLPSTAYDIVIDMRRLRDTPAAAEATAGIGRRKEG